MRYEHYRGDEFGRWVSHDLQEDCLEYQKLGMCSHHHTGEYPRGFKFSEPKEKTEADKSIELYFIEAEVIGLEEASKRLKERIKLHREQRN